MTSALCIMGPTASGKTDLALSLARQLPVEIINVDSAQIYQGMEIGSGMPDKTNRAEIPHHLMDFLDPACAYSAAQFRLDALKVMAQTVARGKIPLLVGGTMLYFKALQQGLSPLPVSSPLVRHQLQQEALSTLYQRLEQVDAISAQRISCNDSQRIQRALEIYAMTGKPMSYWLAQPKESVPDYQFINIGLMPLTTLRSELHQRIEQRFDNMLAQGLISEVEQLRARGDLDLSKPALRAVGYRQVWRYLQGEDDFIQMREKAIAATRQLAKRQMTWLRSWPNLTIVDFKGDWRSFIKIAAQTKNNQVKGNSI